MLRLGLFVLSLIIPAAALAQGGTSAPKYSNEFLAIGIGARAMGMSNACVASTTDVTAGYWNPANLTLLQSDFEVGAMHAEYFGGIAKFDFGGIAKKIDDHNSIGFSFIRFGVDNIPNTTELIDNEGNINYDRVTEFTAADHAFILSYARRSKNHDLRYGANFKVVYRKVGDFARSWGFGLDAGITWRKKGWVLAAFTRDVTSTFNAWSYSLNDRTKEVFLQTGNEIPQNSLEVTLPRLVMAVSRRFEMGKFTVQPEFNVDLTFDGKRNVLLPADPVSFDPHLGLEAGFKNIIFLRTGVGNIQRIEKTATTSALTLQPTVGAGVRIKRLWIDYALTNIAGQLPLFTNVFSLRLEFNKGDDGSSKSSI
jgi:hypothetical protein